jgi:hypothetical protein
MTKEEDQDDIAIAVRPGGYPTGQVGAEFQQGNRRPPPQSPIIAEAVPLPLAARSRIRWRVAALALCLLQCRGQSATVSQLHILTWAVQNQSNFHTLSQHWIGRAPGTTLRVWNPELEDTLRIAVAAGVIEQSSNGRQKLTTEGISLAQQLSSSGEEVMSVEQELLKELGRISTAGMMKRLSGVAVEKGGVK